MQRKPRDAAVNYCRKRCLTIQLLTFVIFVPVSATPSQSKTGKVQGRIYFLYCSCPTLEVKKIVLLFNVKKCDKF